MSPAPYQLALGKKLTISEQAYRDGHGDCAEKKILTPMV